MLCVGITKIRKREKYVCDSCTAVASAKSKAVTENKDGTARNDGDDSLPDRERKHLKRLPPASDSNHVPD